MAQRVESRGSSTSMSPMTCAAASPRRLLVSAVATIAMALGTGRAMAQSHACSAPEYHQLDFWLGNWNAYDDDGKGPYVARDEITTMLDGCEILEQYRRRTVSMAAG